MPRMQVPLSHRKASFSSAEAALGIATDVALLLGNVPYVKEVAGLLVQILKIRDEVVQLKESSRELIDLIAARSLPILQGLEMLDLETVMGLEQLESDLKSYRFLLTDIHSQLSQLTRRRTMFITFHRADIKAALDRFKRQIDDFNVSFNVSRLTEITHDVKRIAKDTRDVKVLVQAQANASGHNAGSSFMFQEPLPPPRKLLLGREEELARLQQLLVSCENPHIAIIGPGGIGKTALATSLLHHPQIATTFGDSRYFVSCEHITSVTTLLNAIANVLRIPHAERGQSLQSSVLRDLRRSPTLLCLDNFEDPWDAVRGKRQDLELLLSHLDTLPHLAIIITTRVSERPPNMFWNDSEAEDLRPLPEDAAVALFEHFSKCSDPRIRDLIDAVERLPLAIELLSRQVGRDTLDSFMEVWKSEGLKLLDGGAGLDHRLSSVYASIRISLSSLRIARHPSAANVLRLLATLPDGLALPTVKHVQSFLPSTILLQQSLRVLCSASLIYKDSTDRFRVLAPIRQYVEEFIQLDMDSLRALSLAFMTLINDDRLPHRSPHFHTTVRELSNVESMIIHGLPLWEAERAELIHGAVNLTYWQGYVTRPNVELLRVALNHSTTPRLLAECHYALGVTYLRVSYFDAALEAEESLLLAMKLSRDCGDVAMEGMSWVMLGNVHSDLGRWTEAEADLKKAFPLLLQVKNLQGQADLLVTMAWMFWMDGSRRYRDAEGALFHALAVFRQLEHSSAGQSDAHYCLGRLYLKCTRMDDAEMSLLNTLELAQDTNNLGRVASCHVHLGRVYTHQNRHADAEAAFVQAISLFQQTENLKGEAYGRLHLGHLYVALHLHDFDHNIAVLPPTNLGGREDAAGEFSRSQALYERLGFEANGKEEASRCFHFVQLPMLKQSCEAFDPILWEPVTEPYDEWLARIVSWLGP